MPDKTNIRPVRLFISYAQPDKEHKDTLCKHLNRFMGGKGEIWVDHMILPGADWKEEHRIQLHRCDLVLFLMSIDSIDSDFIWNEALGETFKRSEKREVDFVPVFLRACQWQKIPDLARFKAIPEEGMPIIHSTYWASHDEPFSKAADAVNSIVETIWQRINQKIIEKNRPKGFLGIRSFLKGNPHFFDMDTALHNSSPRHSEEVLYFIYIKNYLSALTEQIRAGDSNGLQWVEETLEQLDLFHDICKKMETVWRCSDYVWKKLELLHSDLVSKAANLETHVSYFIGADEKRIDHYMANYALPFLFSIEEYANVLEELIEAGLSAQSQ